ncbi:MAG: HEPN domain-containing protein [Candidatus Hadarchaeaceae archaeon]
MRGEVKNWWKSGKNDLETARYNLNGNRLDAAAFFAQQAAEKVLKALQIKKLGKFERTHDLILLAKSVDAPMEVIQLCELIAPFYTVTRYPDVLVSYDKRKVSSVVEASEKVGEWVGRNLT